MKTTPLIPKELIKLVENFKSEVFNKHELPNHKCFCVSYPLSLYLQINGYNNSLKGGKFPSTSLPISHTWIELNNGIIVDLTIEQFSDYLSIKDLPFIFLNDFENNNLNTDKHNKWFRPLKNNDEWLEKTSSQFIGYFEYPLDFLGEENIREIGFDVRDFLRISLKAAIVLNNEIGRRGIDINDKNRDDSEGYLEYFNFIYWIIIVASKHLDLSLVISEFENNEDFHYLISKLGFRFSK